MLNNVINISTKQIIRGGDLNFYFKSLLEAKGGNPVFKRKSVLPTIEIKETFNLCDISIVRKRKSTRFTFQQNQVKDYTKRRLSLSQTYSNNTLPKLILLLLFPVIILRYRSI